jgi:hypothetical protein
LKIFKIAIYGDSLACPRKGVVESHQRYIALVDQFLHSQSFDYIELRDKAAGGISLPMLYNSFYSDNTYFSLPGDILIIHAGIVDCAPRPVSDRLRSKISILPAFIRQPIISYIHKNRRQLILKGKKYVRTDKQTFEKTLDAFLEQSIPHYKKILIINICPTTTEFNDRSPGLSDSISIYNEIISESIRKKKSAKVELIDIHSLIMKNKEKIIEYIVKEDGHHIHPVTHKIIAEKIISKCSELF